MNERAEIESLYAISVYLHHDTPGLSPDAERDQNAGWSFRQRDKALRGMHYCDGVLEARPFVTGDTFTLADTVVCGQIFAGLVALPIPPACRALAAWSERMQQRPSVRDRVSMSDTAR